MPKVSRIFFTILSRTYICVYVHVCVSCVTDREQQIVSCAFCIHVIYRFFLRLQDVSTERKGGCPRRETASRAPWYSVIDTPRSRLEFARIIDRGPETARTITTATMIVVRVVHAAAPRLLQNEKLKDIYTDKKIGVSDVEKYLAAAIRGEMRGEMRLQQRTRRICDRAVRAEIVSRGYSCLREPNRLSNYARTSIGTKGLIENIKHRSKEDQGGGGTSPELDCSAQQEEKLINGVQRGDLADN
uniref:Uncharacterized protein n=1 Tax=Trichogramma kaykai TaxID=54128 RepID=A0ABD2XNJ4_9HYME